MEQKFCQSCGMPLSDEILGTNADGSKNEDYCIYCLKDGAFTGDFTMEEMAEDKNLPHAEHPMKKVFIDEVNALGLPELKVSNLYVLSGSFVNQAYTIEGNEVKLLDDNAMYWGTQVQKTDGRCYGVACSEQYILVSEYGADGADAKLVMLKKR